MSRWFLALTRREQLMIALAAVFLPLALAWQFAWLPLQEARATQAAEIARLDTLIYVAAQAGPVTAEPRAVANPTPPSQRITQSAAQAGITVTRIEPEGGLFRVSVAELPFDDAIAWIADLQATHGLAADQVDMARRTAPGTVSMTLTLEPQT